MYGVGGIRRRHYSVLGMHNRSKRYACVYLVSVLLTFKHSMHGDKLVVGTPPPPGNLRGARPKQKKRKILFNNKKFERKKKKRKERK